MTNIEGNYALIVSFPDASQSYVNGFEAGEIWKDMQSCADIERAVHAENKTVIERMAVASGYNIEIEKTDYPQWLNLIGRKMKTAPKTPNPNGLRIVE